MDTAAEGKGSPSIADICPIRLARLYWRDASVFHITNPRFWEACLLPTAVVVVIAFSSCMDAFIGQFISLTLWYAANLYSMIYALQVLHPQLSTHSASQCAFLPWSLGIAIVEMCVHHLISLPIVARALGTTIYCLYGSFWLHAVMLPWRCVPRGWRLHKLFRYVSEHRPLKRRFKKSSSTGPSVLELARRSVDAIDSATEVPTPTLPNSLRRRPQRSEKTTSCAGHVALCMAAYGLLITWVCAFKGDVLDVLHGSHKLGGVMLYSWRGKPSERIDSSRSSGDDVAIVGNTWSIERGSNAGATRSALNRSQVIATAVRNDSIKLPPSQELNSILSSKQSKHAKENISGNRSHLTLLHMQPLKSETPSPSLRAWRASHPNRTHLRGTRSKKMEKLLETLKNLTEQVTMFSNESVPLHNTRVTAHSDAGPSLSQSSSYTTSTTTSAITTKSTSSFHNNAAGEFALLPSKNVVSDFKQKDVNNAEHVSVAELDSIASETSTSKPGMQDKRDRLRTRGRVQVKYVSETSTSKRSTQESTDRLRRKDGVRMKHTSETSTSKRSMQEKRDRLRSRDRVQKKHANETSTPSQQHQRRLSEDLFGAAPKRLVESTAALGESGEASSEETHTTTTFKFAAWAWGEVLVLGSVGIMCLWLAEGGKKLEFSIPYLILYNVIFIRVPDLLGHTVISSLREVHLYTTPSLATAAISCAYMLAMQVYLIALRWVCRNMSSQHIFPRFHFVAQMYYYLFWYMMLMVISPGGVEDWSFWIMVAMLNGNYLASNLGVLQHMVAGVRFRSLPPDPPLKILFDSKLAVQDQLADIVSLMIVPAIATSFHVCTALSVAQYPHRVLISLWQRFGALLIARLLSGLLTEEIFRRRVDLLYKADAMELQLIPVEPSLNRSRYLNDICVGPKLALESMRNIERCELYFTVVAVSCAFAVFQQGDAPVRYAFIAFGSQ